MLVIGKPQYVLMTWTTTAFIKQLLSQYKVAFCRGPHQIPVFFFELDCSCKGLLLLVRPESVQILGPALLIHRSRILQCTRRDIAHLASWLAVKSTGGYAGPHCCFWLPRNTYTEYQHKHTSTQLGKPLWPSFLRMTVLTAESRDWAKLKALSILQYS